MFSGVGKTADELRLALRSGILLFNVESEGELELLAACAAELRKVADIALRVNPDVPAETHPYISTGLREHKFGVPISSARELCRRAAQHKYLRVAGVSLHIGSQISDVTPFHLAMERAVDLALELIADGHKIRFIDAGGGLGISYNSSAPVEFNELAHRYEEAITEPLLRMKKPIPHLLLEPGRSIIAPAGALVTRVLYLKRNGNKRFTIVDAAMNDLIRPSLYQARHEITPVNLIKGRSEHVQSDIAGPVCESGDFLARDAILPTVTQGENLCVLDAGAYGMSLASNYNSRPRAAEVLVEGTRARLIRRRETIKDLLATGGRLLMTDLKALAYEFLHEAQETLKSDGYLNPTAIVITPDENLIFDIEFETEEERDEIYSEMMDVAQQKNASAIITVNDVFPDDSVGAPVQLQGEGWGQLAEAPTEAILITVSGSGFDTWSLICPYFRRDDRINFHPAREIRNPGGEVELLGDWTGKAGAA